MEAERPGEKGLPMRVFRRLESQRLGSDGYSAPIPPPPRSGPWGGILTRWCSPTGRRCVRSPVASTSTPASTAPARTASSAGSPVTASTELGCAGALLVEPELDGQHRDLLAGVAAARLGRPSAPEQARIASPSTLASLPGSQLGEGRLRGDDASELPEDELREYELDAAVDGLLEQAARRPLGEDRRDEHVRVAEHADGSAPVGAHVVDEPLGVLGADPRRRSGLRSEGPPGRGGGGAPCSGSPTSTCSLRPAAQPAARR